MFCQQNPTLRLMCSAPPWCLCAFLVKNNYIWCVGDTLRAQKLNASPAETAIFSPKCNTVWCPEEFSVAQLWHCFFKVKENFSSGSGRQDLAKWHRSLYILLKEGFLFIKSPSTMLMQSADCVSTMCDNCKFQANCFYSLNHHFLSPQLTASVWVGSNFWHRSSSFLSRQTDNAQTSLTHKHTLHVAYVSLPQSVTSLQLCK